MPESLITTAVLEEIAFGCAILGSGGGGDIAFDLPPARASLERYGPVRLITQGSLKEDSLIVPIAFMGAPLEPSTNIAGQKELERLLEAVEHHYGQKVDALIPLEIGGGNGLTPLAHAGRLNIAVLDADTIGRAFPMLHMTSCSLANVVPSPAFIADAQGNTVILHTQDAHATEKLARAVTVSCGSVTALATYIVRGYQVTDTLVHGSYSLAQSLGQAFLQKKAVGTYVASGIIMRHEPKLEGGFLIGNMQLDTGVSIVFQNEYLFATKNGEILASTPNIIAIVDVELQVPLAIEAIKVGQKVNIYTLPALDLWLTPKGMQVAGPEAFCHLLKI